MNKRIPFTFIQKIIELLTIGVMLFLFVYLVINWSSIPERIPSHFNALGEANAWSNKSTVLLMPILCFVLYVIMTAVSMVPAIWNTPIKLTEENYVLVNQSTRSLICFMKLTVVVTFSYITICIATGKQLGIAFLPIVLIVLAGSFVVYFLKIKKCK
jgi:Predicted membrane protein